MCGIAHVHIYVRDENNNSRDVYVSNTWLHRSCLSTPPISGRALHLHLFATEFIYEYINQYIYADDEYDDA